ncbi:hypothetical protein SAMN04487928_1224 [Butyrivibrio proteoclasticus]|uniref:Transglutaminase-like domain-containing protein n=1 Tax=Butyrivibrio proteoclasticus TaxID=43305 RepID=A0A1I5WE57_9FIRM|nr:transglutaminase domain-containing protein [Butyrivibrio proteoclasticus]SFQ18022.1 hypothetical protein SAMN04487928_1224 [Butyrivibrio proteoclasticus]
MKKIISAILYAILAVVLLACSVIVLYAVNPSFKKFLDDHVDKLPKPVAEIVESTTERSTEITPIDGDTEIVETAEDDNVDLDEYGHHVLDFDRDWDTDGLDDEYVEEQHEVDYDDSVFPEGSDEFVNDKADANELEPETVTVEDEDQANEIVRSTDKGETGDDLSFDNVYYPYYNMLNDRGKSLYNQVYANANALNTEFAPVLEDTSHSELYNAVISVIFDHPEIFWLDTSVYTEFDYQGNIIKVNLHFYDALGDIKSAQSKFYTAADELLEGAKGLSTDYDKELYIHDLLIDKLTYREGPLDQTAYSAIAEDYTVCAGYAKAMQYLMQQLEIPTYFCLGWGGSFFGGGLHGWDIVQLDSDFYNVDCTWDDQNPEVYDYFNVTDSENYWHGRLWNSKYLPDCNGTKYAFEGNGNTTFERTSDRNLDNTSNSEENYNDNQSETQQYEFTGSDGNVELDEYGHHKLQ